MKKLRVPQIISILFLRMDSLFHGFYCNRFPSRRWPRPEPVFQEAFHKHIAVHAVIPKPIRLKSFHVWQFMQSSRDLSGVKLSMYGSSCSYTKLYQAWSFPYIAVHAVIPRPIRIEAFHVWQLMQLYQALSGLKLAIYSSSCSYSKTYQAWSFPYMAVHSVIPRPIRLEAFH